MILEHIFIHLKNPLILTVPCILQFSGLRWPFAYHHHIHTIRTRIPALGFFLFTISIKVSHAIFIQRQRRACGFLFLAVAAVVVEKCVVCARNLFATLTAHECSEVFKDVDTRKTVTKKRRKQTDALTRLTIEVHSEYENVHQWIRTAWKYSDQVWEREREIKREKHTSKFKEQRKWAKRKLN